MNSQDLHNLQEAYLEVVSNQLDEELSGERLSKAETKMKSLGGPSREAWNRVSIGKEGTGTEGGRKSPTKRGGGGTKGQAKVSGSGGDDMDRGSGNRAARRAGTYRKSIWESDIYDIILSHLLDEGYADTQEQAQVIMVNMSEEWRESIFENVSSGKGRVTRYVQSRSTGPVTNRELDTSRQKRMDAENDRIKKIGDEAHAAATSKGLSFAEAEFRRKRAELRARKNS